METSTSKFLQKIAKLKEIEDNNKLKLHFRSHLQSFQGVTSSQLHAQNEHFQARKKSVQSLCNAKLECQFCFSIDVPIFKVQRIRKKGDKKLNKSAIFQCKKCKKPILPKRTLPQIENPRASRSRQTSEASDPVLKSKQIEDKSVQKKKKSKNAGLIIPPKIAASNSKKNQTSFASSTKLKHLLQASSDHQEQSSKLEKMLKS